MKNNHIVILLAVILLFIACSKKQTINIINSPDEEFNQAMDLYDTKKYTKAVNAFQNIIFNYPGTSYGADAQFYLADAYFQSKDYQSAVPEFEFFINSFVGNQFLEDAYYKLALSYFLMAPAVGKDQVILTKTIEILDNLEEKFPETKHQSDILDLKKQVASRWAEKDYKTGELYYKGGEYGSARIYFDNVITGYAQTKWADWSSYYIGQILEESDSTSQAIQIYRSLQTELNDPEVKTLAQKRLEILEPKK